MIEELAIKDLEQHGELQPREDLDWDVVVEYADEMRNGTEFPPIQVVREERNGHTWLWPWDGFHRIAAAGSLGRSTILAEVEEGTKRDAILHSVSANATHGLRRSNADKRKAVTTLLEDPEWSAWSDRRIAEQTQTSHTFVAKLRAATGNVASERTYERDGETLTMDISGIKAANEARAAGEGEDEDGEKAPDWLREAGKGGIDLLAMRPGVDRGDLGMIVNTSVDYADHYVKRASRQTLHAAREYERANRNRSSLISKIEAQLKLLDGNAVEIPDWVREPQAPGAPTREAVYRGLVAYLDARCGERGEDDRNTIERLTVLEQMTSDDRVPDGDFLPDGTRPEDYATALDNLITATRAQLRREQDSDDAEPEYAPVWELELVVRKYLDEQGIDPDLDARTEALASIRDNGGIQALSSDLPESYRKGDLIQAINNVLDQERQSQNAVTQSVPGDGQDDGPEYATRNEIVESVRDYLRVKGGDDPRSRFQLIVRLTGDQDREALARFMPDVWRDADLHHVLRDMKNALRHEVQARDERAAAQSAKGFDATGPSWMLMISNDEAPLSERRVMVVRKEDGAVFRGLVGELLDVVARAVVDTYPEAEALLAPEPKPEPSRPMPPVNRAERMVNEQVMDVEPEDEDDAFEVGGLVRWGPRNTEVGRIQNFSGSGAIAYLVDMQGVPKRYPVARLEAVDVEEVTA